MSREKRFPTFPIWEKFVLPDLTPQNHELNEINYLGGINNWARRLQNLLAKARRSLREMARREEGCGSHLGSMP